MPRLSPVSLQNRKMTFKCKALQKHYDELEDYYYTFLQHLRESLIDDYALYFENACLVFNTYPTRTLKNYFIDDYLHIKHFRVLYRRVKRALDEVQQLEAEGIPLKTKENHATVSLVEHIM